MGYSHYWERPAVLGTEEEFEEFAKDCRKIFVYCENDLGIKLADRSASTGSAPNADKNEVSFNGSNEQPIGIWTTYEDISVPWPSTHASLIDSDAVVGKWAFGSTVVGKRVAPCDDTTGLGKGSHESVKILRCISENEMQLDPNKNEPLFFGSCKTGYRPYDLTLTAVLIALKHHFPTCLISSDGADKDWLDGRVLCNNILGYGFNAEIRTN